MFVQPALLSSNSSKKITDIQNIKLSNGLKLKDQSIEDIRKNTFEKTGINLDYCKKITVSRVTYLDRDMNCDKIVFKKKLK